jgi:hypothetical protein
MEIDKLIRIHIDVIQVNTALGQSVGDMGIHQNKPPRGWLRQSAFFFELILF